MTQGATQTTPPIPARPPPAVVVALGAKAELAEVAQGLAAEGLRVVSCAGPAEVLEALPREPEAILLVEAKLLPTAAEALAGVRERWPSVRRVLLADEASPLRAALNGGLVQRLLLRPIDTATLVASLKDEASQRHLAEEASELQAYAAKKTRELNLAQRLLRLQQMAAVGQLAGGLAHELNNPLGSILAFSQILIREGTIVGDDLEALQFIEQGAIRCKRVIDAVVRFAHQSPGGPPERLALAEVARETMALMRKPIEHSGASPTLEVDASIAVAGSFQQLQQLTQALLMNALEAVAEKSREGRLTLRVFAREGKACLEVGDNGRGIHHSLRDRLFEPFYTTKIEGEAAGLGLTTAARIAQTHGGMIQVDSEPERGSTFTLVLPQLGPEELSA